MYITFIELTKKLKFETLIEEDEIVGFALQQFLKEKIEFDCSVSVSQCITTGDFIIALYTDFDINIEDAYINHLINTFGDFISKLKFETLIEEDEIVGIRISPSIFSGAFQYF